jgi:hypothetical protein
VYLPRLAVLVSIEADRPGAWFPGPLGQYKAWFPPSSLVGTLNVESAGKPHEKSVFVLASFGGSYSKKKNREQTAESRKTLADWPV